MFSIQYLGEKKWNKSMNDKSIDENFILGVNHYLIINCEKKNLVKTKHANNSWINGTPTKTTQQIIQKMRKKSIFKLRSQ